MDTIKSWGTGAIITILIGGTAYTINQADVVNNFAVDTGLTQEQAEQYVSEVGEDDLAPFDVIGTDFINAGGEMRAAATAIDCANYEYEWESATLSCQKGKTQVNKLANDFTSLGQAYIKLSSDSASEFDISETIRLIDQLNSDFQLEIISMMVDWSEIDEMRKTNSYNKAVLQATLESN